MNLMFNSLSKVRSLSKLTNIDDLADVKNLSGLLPEGDLKSILRLADENNLTNAAGISELLQFGNLNPDKLKSNMQSYGKKYVNKLENAIGKDGIFTKIDTEIENVTKMAKDGFESTVLPEAERLQKNVEEEMEKQTGLDISLDFFGDYDKERKWNYKELVAGALKNYITERKVIDMDEVKDAAKEKVVSEAEKVIEQNGLKDKALQMLNNNGIVDDTFNKFKGYIPDDVEPYLESAINAEEPPSSFEDFIPKNFDMKTEIENRIATILGNTNEGDAFTKIKELIDEIDSFKNGGTDEA